MIESGDKSDSPLFDNSDKTVVEENQGNYFYNKYLTDVSGQHAALLQVLLPRSGAS